jgi:hypothetical protein
MVFDFLFRVFTGSVLRKSDAGRNGESYGPCSGEVYFGEVDFGEKQQFYESIAIGNALIDIEKEAQQAFYKRK